MERALLPPLPVLLPNITMNCGPPSRIEARDSQIKTLAEFERLLRAEGQEAASHAADIYSEQRKALEAERAADPDFSR